MTSPCAYQVGRPLLTDSSVILALKVATRTERPKLVAELGGAADLAEIGRTQALRNCGMNRRSDVLMLATQDNPEGH